MKKFYIAITSIICGIIILGLSGTSFANPVLMIDSTSYNAGKKPAGSEVQHTFIIKNEGTSPLLIEQVVPSCGCTLASYDSFIAPGKSGKISVNVELYREWVGQEYHKTVSVVSNDPKNPRLRLSIIGSVGAEKPTPKPTTIKNIRQNSP